MPRMSIYVADELKERMDEREGINWSSVAQRAFELEIRSTSQGGENMDEVVERLRASKEKREQQERPVWVNMGRKWAMHKAEYDQLERVADIVPVAYVEGRAREGPRDALINAIVREIYDEEPEGYQIQEFLELLTGDLSRRPRFVHLEWWLDGVSEVWEQVKDKID